MTSNPANPYAILLAVCAHTAPTVSEQDVRRLARDYQINRDFRESFAAAYDVLSLDPVTY
jgi:hypothetical protein